MERSHRGEEQPGGHLGGRRHPRPVSTSLSETLSDQVEFTVPPFSLNKAVKLFSVAVVVLNIGGLLVARVVCLYLAGFRPLT